jgi:hypothetical protein
MPLILRPDTTLVILVIYLRARRIKRPVHGLADIYNSLKVPTKEVPRRRHGWQVLVAKLANGATPGGTLGPRDHEEYARFTKLHPLGLSFRLTGQLRLDGI